MNDNVLHPELFYLNKEERHLKHMVQKKFKGVDRLFYDVWSMYTKPTDESWKAYTKEMVEIIKTSDTIGELIDRTLEAQKAHGVISKELHYMRESGGRRSPYPF